MSCERRIDGLHCASSRIDVHHSCLRPPSADHTLHHCTHQTTYTHHISPHSNIPGHSIARSVPREDNYIQIHEYRTCAVHHTMHPLSRVSHLSGDPQTSEMDANRQSDLYTTSQSHDNRSGTHIPCCLNAIHISSIFKLECKMQNSFYKNSIDTLPIQEFAHFSLRSIQFYEYMDIHSLIHMV